MASLRRLRRRSCGDKVRHKSPQGAFAHLKAMKNAALLNIYRCRFCKGWHVGHPPDRERHRGRRT